MRRRSSVLTIYTDARGNGVGDTECPRLRPGVSATFCDECAASPSARDQSPTLVENALNGTGRRVAWVGWRLFLIGALLTFPLWEPPLERRIDPYAERTEIAVEAEREARAGGELVRLPSGETRRAVVYTPAGPTDGGRTERYLTWLCRLIALTIVLQLIAGPPDWDVVIAEQTAD